MKVLGYTILKGLSVVLYFVAPVVYLYLKCADTINGEHEENEENDGSKKIEFSPRGFILGCFLFFFTFTFLHATWIGHVFGSWLSILVTVYLSICTWTLSFTLKELDSIIDSVLEKPLGHVFLIFVNLGLYFVSPVVFIRLKFFNEK